MRQRVSAIFDVEDGLVDLREGTDGNSRPVIVSAVDLAFVVLLAVEMKKQKKCVSSCELERGARERSRREKQNSRRAPELVLQRKRTSHCTPSVTSFANSVPQLGFNPEAGVAKVFASVTQRRHTGISNFCIKTSPLTLGCPAGSFFLSLSDRTGAFAAAYWALFTSCKTRCLLETRRQAFDSP
jgi:hypothetical protein